MSEDRQMFRQVLLAGKDYAPDYEAEPGPDGKYPVREFKKGDVRWSEEDLVAKEPTRYAAYGPPRARERVSVARAKALRTGTPVATPGVDVAPADTAATRDAARGEDKRAQGKAPLFTREELEGQTKAELKDLADQCKVEVHGNWTKEQMIDALVAGPGGDDGE